MRAVLKRRQGCFRAGTATIVLAGMLGWAVVWSEPSPTNRRAQTACGDYGTAIEFEASPKAAARRAAAEEKLVMVLHVSGHFENPGLT